MESIQTEAQRVQQKYDESLELTINLQVQVKELQEEHK